MGFVDFKQADSVEKAIKAQNGQLFKGVALVVEKFAQAKSKPNPQNKMPCFKFIVFDCKYGEKCTFSHDNCKDIKACDCCKFDTTGKCKKDAADCIKKHNCCKEKYKSLCKLAGKAPEDEKEEEKEEQPPND